MKRLRLALILAAALSTGAVAGEAPDLEVPCTLRHAVSEYLSIEALPKPTADFVRALERTPNGSFRFDRAVRSEATWFVWLHFSGMPGERRIFIAKEKSGTLERRLMLFVQGPDPCVVIDTLLDGVWPANVTTSDFHEYSFPPGTPWRLDP